MASERDEFSIERVVSMSGAELGLALSVFLACAVEAVEALTIVLAVGTTRSWSSAIERRRRRRRSRSPRSWRRSARRSPRCRSTLLRVLVGGLLLIFGLQWLRKAILRARGAEGQARRAADLRGGARGGARGGRAARGLRRLRVHDRLQGRAAGGPGGRVHRAHVRRQPAPRRPRGRRRRARRARASSPRASRRARRSRGCPRTR